MGKLLRRDLMYLYTSVFSAGIRNIAVQMFFDSHYPENKETLVSVALFLSALCTMFGIMLSTKLIRSQSPVWASRKNRLLLTAGMSLTVCLSFTAMFLVKALAVYLFLFGISSFSLNFMYNVFDVFICGTVSEGEREKNVRILLIFQMAGYIAGPLFFSFFAAEPWMCIMLSAVLLLICYLPVIRAYIAYTGDAFKRKAAEESATDGSFSASVRKADRNVMLYSFMMYSATNTLMTSVAYIMKDHLHVTDYAVKSSIFLAGTVLVSAAVIALFPAVKMWKLRLTAPAALAAALAMILILHSSSPVLLTIAAILSGAGNGIFLSGSRYYVNHADAACGLVGRYNRVMTEATLTGFLTAAVISWLCLRTGFTVVPAKLTAIIIMLAAAGFFACTKALRNIPQRSKPPV